MKLEQAAKVFSDYLHGRIECPECGDGSEKEHNGCTIDPTWLCTECGHQWSEEEP